MFWNLMKWENSTGIIRNKMKDKQLKYNNPNPPISVSCLQLERLILLMRGQLFARADIPISVI